MAIRPIFTFDECGGVISIDVEFDWYPGVDSNGKKHSIRRLHKAGFLNHGILHVLEVSNISDSTLGRYLSAMNLMITLPNGKRVPLEVAYQSSKVFENGGPYLDILDQNQFTCKRDTRLRTSGALTGFNYFGAIWGLTKPLGFYDWLYINAFNQNFNVNDADDIINTQFVDYNGFTDIFYVPQHGGACQARTCAYIVNLLNGNEQDNFNKVVSVDGFKQHFNIDGGN